MQAGKWTGTRSKGEREGGIHSSSGSFYIIFISVLRHFLVVSVCLFSFRSSLNKDFVPSYFPLVRFLLNKSQKNTFHSGNSGLSILTFHKFPGFFPEILIGRFWIQEGFSRTSGKPHTFLENRGIWGKVCKTMTIRLHDHQATGPSGYRRIILPEQQAERA